MHTIPAAGVVCMPRTGVWRGQPQVRGFDAFMRRQQCRALQHVAQLAHVARPGVRQQRALGLRRQRASPRQEMARQRQDVVGSRGERRQRQLDRVEAVVQVLAELSGADHRLKVGVGRADDAHLDGALAVGAQPLEASGLQHAQQLHLAGRGQGADLVQEQRAAIGGLELAFARAGGARVRPRLGPEQFGFHQLARQRAAVERDERTVPHRRIGMHDLGELLLAGAVRAGQQHRQVRARHLAGQREQAFGRGVGPD